ncbi:MAG: TspO/MBR family protein [Candidatus Aenigmatarchaeota archaeon]
MQRNDFIKIIVAILIPLMTGFVGSVFTADAVSGWYPTLQKPAFTPPNWVFGPAWTALYILMGISLYLVWREGFERREVKVGIGIFAVQLFLNALWSFLFFGLRSPLLGLVEIIPLWIAILATVIYFYRISKKASYLLIPYLAWTSFAALLNYSIFILN